MPSPYIRTVFAGRPETRVYKSRSGRKKTVNKSLLGTWMGVTEERDNGWLKVVTAGPGGWVRESDVRANCGLKVFFIDVGQGDACLVETPTKRLLIDGGQTRGAKSYLYWQFRYLRKAGQSIHLDAVFATHFDADHYKGLTMILEDPSFSIGRFYHNGIARFHTSKKKRPAKYDTDLGRSNTHGQPSGTERTVLKTSFSTLADARKLLRDGGLQPTFRKFLEAAVKAADGGRLGSLKILTTRDEYVPGFKKTDDLSLEILGPLPTKKMGPIHFPWFSGSSHTRNGHSLMLRAKYGDTTVLLGGDLNTEAEQRLMHHYRNRKNPFGVDIAKSCHHGSSDFSVAFMKAVKPYATVISSGDNESYAHPRSDAIGAAGRYSRGRSPLVFSTELARSYNSKNEILYGMINLRTDGKQIVLAQLKEKRTGVDVWDSYAVPFKEGRP